MAKSLRQSLELVLGQKREGERGVPGDSQDCVVALGNYYESPGVCESHGELRLRSLRSPHSAPLKQAFIL